MIQVYPKLKVFCPMIEDDIDGNKCLNCKYFQGISVNDYESVNSKEIKKSVLFFRCFYKKEAGTEK